MTVASEVSSVSFTGDGSNTVFPYTFLIFAATDLQVFVDDVLQTLNTHYTVSGVGSPGGGNVTFTSPPALNARVAIVRAVPYTQLTDYVENDPFPAETHERALDKVTILTQQLKDAQARALVAPPSTVGFSGQIPNPNVAENKGKVLRIKPDGTGIEVVDTSTLPAMNPIIAQGDLIRGGAGGVPERLAVGAEGAYLKVASGVPAWGSLNPRTLLLAPAANIPASGGAVLGRVDATSETWYELTFPDAGAAEVTFVIPAFGFTTARVLWRTSATAGDVKWSAEVREKADAGTLGSGTVVVSGTVTDAAKGSADQINEATIALAYTPGAGARLALLRIFRNPADAADTLGADAKLLAVELF